MESSPVTKVKIHKIICGHCIQAGDDNVAVEEPLEIKLQYGSVNDRVKKSISVTMRTPGNDVELAAGFLFTEGIIKNRNQILELNQVSSEENKILVTLTGDALPVLDKSGRNFYAASGCGVCGKSSIEAIRILPEYSHTIDNISLNANIFYGLHEDLKMQQEIFESTGGLHASALFNLEGKFVMLREDVGRHNALDKIIGAAFLNDRLPLTDNFLLLSGRASFELIQKAAMAGLKIVAAVGAPSSLAIELAKENEMTLIGFLKNERFNIYSGEGRVRI